MNQDENNVFDAATLIRRGFFFLLMLTLCLSYIFPLFRGLSSAEGMDHAQISREISRNNGISSKFIRPVAYAKSVAAPDAKSDFVNFRDTHHAPLNLLVNAAVFKLIDAGDTKKWAMTDKKQMIYDLDRVVAGISMTFFILSIGVNYLLVGRIFDSKIAGVTALLMLCCELMWNFSTSGLPQMLMLFLFSCAAYFTYAAVDNSSDGKSPVAPAILGGLFLILLSLTHWICVWILFAYLIYAAIAFRPRGMISLVVAAMAVAFFAYPLWRNYQASGSVLGSAFYVIYSGLGIGEDAAMRVTEVTGSDTTLRIDGIAMKIFRTIILQSTDILPFLGSIFAAPIFFLALVHQFKRDSIAIFRWGIFIMWIFSVVGMSIFGVSADNLHPNQIHILFAPLMTAYGIAFITILWTRLEIVRSYPLLANAHHWILILLSIVPLLLGSYQLAKNGLLRGEAGFPHWPPYFPSSLCKLEQNGAIEADNIIVSDQPWAVAWYADRMSIWLPKKVESFEKLESSAASRKTPISGILITPSSHGNRSIIQITDQFEDFTALCIDGRASLATQPNPVTLFDKSPKLNTISSKYRYKYSLLTYDIIYYSIVPFKIIE